MGYIQRELQNDSDLGIICVEYTKKYISSHYRKIMLKTDGSGNVMSVDGDFIQGIDLSLKKDEFFEGLWIDVPTPFRKGISFAAGKRRSDIIFIPTVNLSFSCRLRIGQQKRRKSAGNS